MKRLVFTYLLIFSVALFQSLDSWSATRTSVGTGNWNNGGTWDTGIPGSGDVAIIAQGDTVTLTATTTITTLVMQGNAVLIINNSQTLTVTGEFWINPQSNSQTTVIQNSGAMSANKLTFKSFGKLGFTVNLENGGAISGLSGTSQFQSTSTGGMTVNIGCPLIGSGRLFINGSTRPIQVNLTDSVDIGTLEISGGNADLDMEDNSAKLRMGDIDYTSGSITATTAFTNAFYFDGITSIPDNANLGWTDCTFQGTNTLGNDFTAADVTIESSGSLATNGNDLDMTGNLVAAGELTMTTGDNWTFNSTAASVQTISGSGAKNFSNLTMDCSNASGGVTVNSAVSIIDNLILTDGAFTTNTNVTLESDSTGKTANFGTKGAGATISGSLVMEKHIWSIGALSDWRHLHAPGQSTNINQLQDGVSPEGIYTFGYTNSNQPSASGFVSTYSFDESADSDFDNCWVAASNATTDQFSPFNGYIWFMGGSAGSQSKANYELQITAQPLIGSQTFAGLSFGNTGWHLLGNPYPSAVDLTNVTMTNIQGNTFYCYSSGSGSYQTVTKAGGGILPAWQSYFANATASGTIGFAETDKSTNSTTDVYKRAREHDELMIRITEDSAGVYTELTLSFIDDASVDFDIHDAYSLTNPFPTPTVWFQVEDSFDVLVNRLPTSAHEVSYPIVVDATVTGDYTLSFSSIPESHACYIVEDLETGDKFSVAEGTEYKFSVSNLNAHERFMFHLSNPVAGLSATPTSCNGSDDGQIVFEYESASLTFDVVWQNEAGDIVKEVFGVTSGDTLTNLAGGNYTMTMYEITGACEVIEEIEVFEPAEVVPDFEVSTIQPDVYINEAVDFTNTSSGASDFVWDFGDGSAASTDVNPTHTFPMAGTYVVKLTASNGNMDCDNEKISLIQAINGAPVSLEDAEEEILFETYGTDHVVLEFPDLYEDAKVRITNALGQPVYESSELVYPRMEIPVKESGMYLVSFRVNQEEFVEKVNVIK